MSNSPDIIEIKTPRVSSPLKSPPRLRFAKSLTRVKPIAHINSKAKRKLFADDDDVEIILTTRPREENALASVKRRRMSRTAAVGSHEDTPIENATIGICLVCNENEACVVTLPCRHMVMCARCTNQWFGRSPEELSDEPTRTCPKCRSIVMTFFVPLKEIE